MNSEASTLLKTWKVIADYLGYSVSKARRMEREKALPVFRDPGGTVCADKTELDKWIYNKIK